MSEHANVVVVGVDGSADSMAALKWAEGYARATDATLRLVTTWAWPVSYGAPMYIEAYNPEAEAEATMEKAMAQLTLPAGQVQTSCRQGQAGPVLVEESSDAALLVVGSHGHSVMSTILLGSASNYCVHHASCSVAVIR
ncbi:MAG TPA: universal stress protein [Mycobacteriales bacterium]|nr:universal stress protein [Mycobacteriales bacterium]